MPHMTLDECHIMKSALSQSKGEFWKKLMKNNFNIFAQVRSGQLTKFMEIFAALDLTS